MGEKDVRAGEYLADNARFADICNYHLHGGREVICPEDLQELDGSEKITFERKRKKGSTVQSRDLLKNAVIRKTETCTIVIIGIENQTRIHYAMPVRNLFYDCINYSRQIKKIIRRNREVNAFASDDEFLSGLKKEDRMKPVITITVYWGTEEWDGPRNLYDMLEIEDKELLKNIDNYHLKLIEPLRMTEEDFKRFHTDVRQVFQAIQVANDKDKMKKLLEEDKTYKNLGQETAMTIETFAHVKLKRKKGEERMDMCKAWEDYRLEGKREGKREGKCEGKREGKREEKQDVAERMLVGKKLTLEEISEYTGLDLDTIKKLKRKVFLEV